MREIKFRFGDIIENRWASEDNPIRKGIFVRNKKDLIELTNGQGKFWEVYHDDNRNVRIGSIYENPELLNF